MRWPTANILGSVRSTQPALLKSDVMLNKGNCLIIKVHGVIEALLTCEVGAQVLLGPSPEMLPVRLSNFALVGTDLSEVRSQLVLLENKSQLSPVILVLTWVQYSLGSSTIELSSILVEPDAYSPNSISSNTLARAAAPYQAFRDSITCLSRATRFPPKTPNYWRSERHV